ncbi:MAG: exodeoxyribonuclease III [Clostridia bacterium]|nr:exodeoxyribonuclease III [Clostridia bacterium]
MKLMSWNVNGLRAVIKKDFFKILEDENPDILCLQETKMQEQDIDFLLFDKYNDYHYYRSSAEKKGYAGTGIFSKTEPKNVTYGINGKYSDEGRIITLEYDNFYLINSYTPNSQEALKRLDYRLEFENDLRSYMVELDKTKPVILCGDLNVAHNDIDIKNPASNHFNPGFSDEEREPFTTLLESGFIDSYREFNPDTIKYSWWSYRFSAREKNIGWRLDYFVTSKKLKDKITHTEIRNIPISCIFSSGPTTITERAE